MTFHNSHDYIGKWEVEPAKTIGYNDVMIFKQYYDDSGS